MDPVGTRAHERGRRGRNLSRHSRQLPNNYGDLIPLLRSQSNEQTTFYYQSKCDRDRPKSSAVDVKALIIRSVGPIARLARAGVALCRLAAKHSSNAETTAGTGMRWHWRRNFELAVVDAARVTDRLTGGTSAGSSRVHFNAL